MDAADQALINPNYDGRLNDAEWLAGVRKDLDALGVVCLADFLSPSAVKRLQSEILQLESKAQVSNEKGNHKYSVKGELLSKTVIGDLAKSDLVVQLINGILAGGAGAFPDLISEPIRIEEIVPGLNIMRGPADVTAFHFDGTFLNILVPVFIPKMDGPNRGQLTIYPNIRSFRKNIYDRIIVPAICRLGMFRILFSPVEIDYEVGNLYLFYGYRSYHGVLHPGQPGLRCTTNMTVGAARF